MPLDRDELKLNEPCKDNEHVESVPRLGKVRLFADNSHRGHLHEHFHGEEGEDEVVEHLKNTTSHGDTDFVGTWFVQAECYTVYQDHSHAHPLKPRSHTVKNSLSLILQGVCV